MILHLHHHSLSFHTQSLTKKEQQLPITMKKITYIQSYLRTILKDMKTYCSDTAEYNKKCIVSSEIWTSVFGSHSRQQSFCCTQNQIKLHYIGVGYSRIFLLCDVFALGLHSWGSESLGSSAKLNNMATNSSSICPARN